MDVMLENQSNPFEIVFTGKNYYTFEKGIGQKVKTEDEKYFSSLKEFLCDEGKKVKLKKKKGDE